MLIMAHHVESVNRSDATFSADTFIVKEEQCQEDSFVEDKVSISDTAITGDNAELQGPIRYGQIKQYDESTCMDNIKTEFVSFQVSEGQNDIVKVKGGISAEDIKSELNNRLLYCEHCGAYYVDYCIECGMLVNILNKNALNSANNGSRADIPNDILEVQDCFGQTGIYALRVIPANVKFGPFTGLSITECPWEMEGGKFVLNQHKSKYLNWMQFVNPTRNTSERNLSVFHCDEDIYYQSTRQIQAGDELLVYFGEEDVNSLKKIDRVNFATAVKDIGRDIFACTFCCFGFSSESHLAKHKTLCVENIAGKFAVEELVRCQYCKIHLDAKEYFEHHMAFCCDRNARRCFLPTPPTKEETTALDGRRRCRRQIYKCDRCNYRTKYPADIKEHISNHHYRVKMYTCRICNRRLNTKVSLRLHVENTHSYVEGKDSRSNCGNIKVEQSRSRDQKKIFKCRLCVFRAKYKESLRRHIKLRHLKEFDYKCDSCEFGTNMETILKTHIKTKHLKEFDYNCDSCEFGTNGKRHLEDHIKTKHLKQFDYQCDSCEYGTNNQSNLKVHIKTKHLKEFDFRCDSCEYRTNNQSNLEVHIKTKHLKQFDFKCDKCEFATNKKHGLKKHIKTKHLKKFDYKCDYCEYGTNTTSHLELHRKTKHLKQFDYKCDACEFGVNNKTDFKRHIKTKHSKEFDYKCDFCEYGTHTTSNLEAHIKSKHLKKFDHKCDSCEYGTNTKSNLKVHIKTKHLKKFDYKCDACEFLTNNKTDLKRHIRTKHLNEFDYKCDSCEYGTNSTSHLEVHIKTKHLKTFDYKCDSCQFGTNFKTVLKRHMKRKHL